MTPNSVSIQSHLGALLVRKVVDDLLALAAQLTRLLTQHVAPGNLSHPQGSKNPELRIHRSSVPSEGFPEQE